MLILVVNDLACNDLAVNGAFHLYIVSKNFLRSILCQKVLYTPCILKCQKLFHTSYTRSPCASRSTWGRWGSYSASAPSTRDESGDL